MLLPPAAQPVVLACTLLFAIYMVWEIWRWLAGNRALLTPGQIRRRIAAAVILQADLLLWLLANPLMSGRPPRDRLLYLLWLTLLALIPIYLAVREAAFVLRQYARWRADLIRSLARSSSDHPAGEAQSDTQERPP